MINSKLKEIREFCKFNSDPEIIKKYSKYFKEGYNGYGIAQNVFEAQRDQWILDLKNEMTLASYLDLGDKLMQNGKLEEMSFTIVFLKSEGANFTENTFNRIGNWFKYGISNWATADVLCMLVLSSFLIDKKISFEKL